jgi:hypothetical protein
MCDRKSFISKDLQVGASRVSRSCTQRLGGVFGSTSRTCGRRRRDVPNQDMSRFWAPGAAQSWPVTFASIQLSRGNRHDLDLPPQMTPVVMLELSESPTTAAGCS